MSEIQPETEQKIKNIKRERKVIKGRLRKERIRFLVKFLTTLGLVAGVLGFIKLDGLYMNPKAFQHIENTSVEIINNRIVPTHKIRTVLQSVQPPQGCILFARTVEIKEKLKQLDPIEDIHIRRYAFPARLQIIVRESTPVITIAPGTDKKHVAYFTDKGKIIGQEYLPLHNSFKTLLVLSYGNKGDDYYKWTPEKIKELQKLAAYIEAYTKEPVEYIDCRNPEEIFVKVPTWNIRIGKLDSGLYDRIKILPSIIAAQINIDTSKIQYIDLIWENVRYLKLNGE